MTATATAPAGTTSPPAPQPGSGHAKRVDPITGLRNTLTLTWRNLVQIKHNPMELLDLSIQPIMFVLLFAYVFGPGMMGGVQEYLPILIPGIIVQNALFMSMTTGFGLNVDVTKGVFDRFRSLPISRSGPLAGRLVADTTKQAWSMLVLLVVGIAIGFRVETNWLALVPAFGLLLAFSLLFSWVAVYIGMIASEPEKVQIFGFTIIFPVTFLSNAFIPLNDNYPGWLRTVMEANPVSQMVDAIRGLLIGYDPASVAPGQAVEGQPVLGPAVAALLWGVVIAAIFAPLAMRAFKKRV